MKLCGWWDCWFVVCVLLLNNFIRRSDNWWLVGLDFVRWRRINILNIYQWDWDQIFQVNALFYVPVPYQAKAWWDWGGRLEDLRLLYTLANIKRSNSLITTMSWMGSCYLTPLTPSTSTSHINGACTRRGMVQDRSSFGLDLALVILALVLVWCVVTVLWSCIPAHGDQRRCQCC